jgi:hypothetical protein
MFMRNSSVDGLLAFAGVCTAFRRFGGFGGITSPNLEMISPKSKHRDLKSFPKQQTPETCPVLFLGCSGVQAGDDPI